MAASQKQHQLRSLARRKALQILFQSEVCGCEAESILSQGLCLEEVGIPCDFTRLLLGGVESHAAEIDGLIAHTSEHWTLERMPLVDRSILRLATFEMMYVDDVPYSVSINEAIELAKSFGGEDESSRFVNGVLGKIAGHLNEQATGGADGLVGADAGVVGGKARSGRTGGVKARSKREKKAVHG
jgi:N utilization substance protein B